ncbi:MAG: O-antigen ligase family protein [Patescibacteria group bacterium]|jgi:hypothetical protein
MIANFNFKYFKFALPIFLAIEILSFLGSIFPYVNPVIFIFLALATIILSIYDLRFGLYLILSELLIGSKGYLFYLTIQDFKISLRLVLFAIVLLIWLWEFLRKKQLEFFTTNYWKYFLVFGVFVLLAILQGWLRNQGLTWYQDFNAWLFWLLAPVFFIVINSRQKINEFLGIFFACVIYLSVKTLFLLIWFAYSAPHLTVDIYQWLRISGLAEVTFIAGNFYRIFMQSQIFLLTGFFISLALLVFQFNRRIDKIVLWLTLILSSTAILASLSRSFWVGLSGALVILTIYAIVKKIFDYKIIFKGLALAVVILFGEIFFLQIITGNYWQVAVGNRVGSINLDAAGISRLQQLTPLKNNIIDNIFLGAGFGKTVTYVSQDPRVLKNNPNGNYLTYAFEWGYLDICLKLGLLGLLAYLAFIAKIGMDCLKSGPLGMGLFWGLIALLIVSMFSPYLNHPLGIGILLFTASISLFLKNNHGN